MFVKEVKRAVYKRVLFSNLLHVNEIWVCQGKECFYIRIEGKRNLSVYGKQEEIGSKFVDWIQKERPAGKSMLRCFACIQWMKKN